MLDSRSKTAIILRLAAGHASLAGIKVAEPKIMDSSESPPVLTLMHLLKMGE